MTGRKKNIQGNMINNIDITDITYNTDIDVKWLFVPFFVFSGKKWEV